jgi:hypothetical protein
VHVYKESPLEGANMSQSGNQWLNRVDGCLGESTQYASGRRALTPEAEQRNMTRAIAEHARRDLIDCQNELDDLQLSSDKDLESTAPRHRTTRDCKAFYAKTKSALCFLSGRTVAASVRDVR